MSWIPILQYFAHTACHSVVPRTVQTICKTWAAQCVNRTEQSELMIGELTMIRATRLNGPPEGFMYVLGSVHMAILRPFSRDPGSFVHKIMVNPHSTMLRLRTLQLTYSAPDSFQGQSRYIHLITYFLLLHIYHAKQVFKFFTTEVVRPRHRLAMTTILLVLSNITSLISLISIFSRRVSTMFNGRLGG